ncbi:hypothetical protein LJB93_01570, partial [Desulfovibrio sp. OttesenSCG-928-F07]|nr:hypothetical protein [Desulfovibrio sp. OttesenSCG-928-F07]
MPFFKTVRSTIFFILFLALIPITVVLAYSSIDTRDKIMHSIATEFNNKLQLLYMRQEVVLDNAFMLTQTVRELNSVLALNSEQGSALLNELLTNTEFYDNIFVCDPKGNVFAAAKNFTSGVNVANSQAFNGALFSRDYYGGALTLDPFTRSLVIPLSRPVLDHNGNVLAIIIISAKSGFYSEFAEGINFTDSAQLTAIDRSGRVIYSYPSLEYVNDITETYTKQYKHWDT